MNGGLGAIFWGILTFSILIVIHEGGHFALARAFGVKVHEFMVGLPGPALRFHGKKTTYGITAIPLGGYVRIAGMEPGPEDPLLGPVLAFVTRNGRSNALAVSEALSIESSDADGLLMTLADWDALVAVEGDDYSYESRFSPEDAGDEQALLDRARSVTYRALPTWKRIAMLSAGVVFNLVTAVLVFTLVLTIFGYLKDTGRIESVTAGSAAAKAGLVAGDRVTKVGDRKVRSFQDLITAVSTYDPGEEVRVVYVTENGAARTVTVVLGEHPEKPGVAMLGVRAEMVPTKPGPLEALVLSLGYIVLTFQAIAGFFNPETFRASVRGSASVIGASVIARDAAQAGALSYAGLVAALSLSLGVINILPIPPLDGGKIAIELVEKLRGRPLSRKVSLSLSAVGAVLLFTLIGYLMYSDVVRLMATG